MKKFHVLIMLLWVGSYAFAKESIDPTISPALFKYNDQITVTYDVTGTSLASLTSAWIWVWIPGKNIDAKYNTNPANSNATLTDNAKFIKSTANGKTTFSITFKPSDFFSGSISAEKQMGILLKGNDWADGQTTDFLANIWDGSFQVKLIAPTTQPLFVSTGSLINVQAQVPTASDFQLFINDVLIDSKTSLTDYSYSFNATETSGGATVKIVATQGGNSASTTFQYLISATSPSQARPSGIIAGINYNPADQTKVTLCLWAPGKTSVYAQGDFSNWDVLPANLMKKDGEYFWIELTGLTSGTEYGYRYLIDEKIYVADPYADKILDPNDQYIPATTYPSLKAFPAKAVKADWYFNRVSVFQTGQTPYSWKVNNFVRKAPTKLAIYELLIRDFFGSSDRRFQNLIDTLSYFKKLGINTIELMPVAQFNGNEGWGYNPTFMFATHKYYGTKDKLKEFIDKCHENGIAVIMDMVLNHQDIPCPYAMMDFDFATFKPTASNKWFNVNATHPYSVFNDMNHESPYAQKFIDTVNYYWLKEYKVDGFRYDLSKGFTQKNSGGDVGAWSSYDASRIALLKRMMAKIRTYSTDSYLILEHFADNTEEKELSDNGFLLWGNMNNSFAQSTMGYASESSVNGLSYKSRGWSVPNLVGYMESHDEERLMAKNIQYGNETATYSTKNLNTGLERVAAAATIFLSVPGPKMIWEFGELGYDFSINYCTNGSTNSNCRLDPKPVHWDYRSNAQRSKVFTRYSEMLHLRESYPVFQTSDVVVNDPGSLVKQIILKGSPYMASPTSADQMNVTVAANFNLQPVAISVQFPHTGTWYDYFTGQTVQVTSVPFSVNFAAGVAALYTDVKLRDVTAIEKNNKAVFTLYPNPTNGQLFLSENLSSIDELEVFNILGQKQMITRLGNDSIDVRSLDPGLYIVRIHTEGKTSTCKFLKQN